MDTTSVGQGEYIILICLAAIFCPGILGSLLLNRLLFYSANSGTPYLFRQGSDTEMDVVSPSFIEPSANIIALRLAIPTSRPWHQQHISTVPKGLAPYHVAI